MAGYATWNPSDKDSDVTLSGGDLVAQVTAGTYGAVRSTLAKLAGKWYCEITFGTATTAECVGFANASATISGDFTATTNAVMMVSNGNIIRNGSVVGGDGGHGTGSVVCLALDFDAGKASWRLNNGAWGDVLTANLPSGALYVAVGSISGSTATFTANFGDSAFTYTPPAGHQGWIDDRITFSGTGSLTVTTQLNEAAQAAFAGSGTLVADAVVKNLYATAAMAGAGSLVAAAGAILATNTAVFAGEGATLFTARLDPRAAVTWVGAGSLVAESTHIVPQTYVLAEEGIPSGGILWGGSPSITENIPFVPTGGLVWGGAAVVTEAIPHIPTGGFVWGGEAAHSIVYPFTPSGGFVWGGTAAVTTIYAEPTITGGFVWGGAASVSTYSAWHQPTGGIVWGGAALAWSETADYTASPENPLNEPFYGWTMNADTTTPSRYYRLPATSMCQHDGKTYVTTAAGIYEFGAEDDAGQDIRASVQFPKTDFSTALTKRMEVAYFGVKSDGRLRLKLVANDDDPRYYVIQPTNDGLKGTRVTIGKGMAGRYWAARLDNVAGSDLELDSAEFLPVRSHHRHGA